MSLQIYGTVPIQFSGSKTGADAVYLWKNTPSDFIDAQLRIAKEKTFPGGSLGIEKKVHFKRVNDTGRVDMIRIEIQAKDDKRASNARAYLEQQFKVHLYTDLGKRRVKEDPRVVQRLKEEEEFKRRYYD